VKAQPLELLAAEVERAVPTTIDVFHGILPEEILAHGVEGFMMRAHQFHEECA
jgi:hypothetical protein